MLSIIKQRRLCKSLKTHLNALPASSAFVFSSVIFMNDCTQGSQLYQSNKVLDYFVVLVLNFWLNNEIIMLAKKESLQYLRLVT